MPAGNIWYLQLFCLVGLLHPKFCTSCSIHEQYALQTEHSIFTKQITLTHLFCQCGALSNSNLYPYMNFLSQLVVMEELTVQDTKQNMAPMALVTKEQKFFNYRTSAGMYIQQCFSHESTATKSNYLQSSEVNKAIANY